MFCLMPSFCLICIWRRVYVTKKSRKTFEIWPNFNFQFGSCCTFRRSGLNLACETNNNNNLICIAPECQRLQRRYTVYSTMPNLTWSVGLYTLSSLRGESPKFEPFVPNFIWIASSCRPWGAKNPNLTVCHIQHSVLALYSGEGTDKNAYAQLQTFLSPTIPKSFQIKNVIIVIDVKKPF